MEMLVSLAAIAVVLMLTVLGVRGVARRASNRATQRWQLEQRVREGEAEIAEIGRRTRAAIQAAAARRSSRRRPR